VPSIEECIVDCFAVREKDYPEVPIFGFRDQDPTPDATICLNDFFDWSPDRSFDPLVTNAGAVRANPDCVEVPCGLHSDNVSETDSADEQRNNEQTGQAPFPADKPAKETGHDYGYEHAR